MKMSSTVTSTGATSSISTPTEVIHLGLEEIEGGWLADQAARDAARLSTEDAPSMFDPEIGVLATPIGTPEIEEQSPDLAQQPTSSPKAWGIADVMDTPLPVSTQSLPVLQPTPALQESSFLKTFLQGTPATNFQNPANIKVHNPSLSPNHNPSLDTQNPSLA